MYEIFGFAAAFLLGAFPTAFLWVRLKTGKDIRTMGSGNVGATNVFRSVGRRDGIAVLILDASKGAAAVLLGRQIVPNPPFDPHLFQFALGCAAILGHVFTPWLGFKGGKGVATGAGVALAIYPLPFMLSFAAWLVILSLTRYMSVASILAAYVFAGSSYFLLPNRAHALAALLAAVFITWTHRANLNRLRLGTEPKLFYK